MLTYSEKKRPFITKKKKSPNVVKKALSIKSRGMVNPKQGLYTHHQRKSTTGNRLKANKIVLVPMSKLEKSRQGIHKKPENSLASRRRPKKLAKKNSSMNRNASRSSNKPGHVSSGYRFNSRVFGKPPSHEDTSSTLSHHSSYWSKGSNAKVAKQGRVYPKVQPDSEYFTLDKRTSKVKSKAGVTLTSIDKFEKGKGRLRQKTGSKKKKMRNSLLPKQAKQGGPSKSKSRNKGKVSKPAPGNVPFFGSKKSISKNRRIVSKNTGVKRSNAHMFQAKTSLRSSKKPFLVLEKKMLVNSKKMVRRGKKMRSKSPLHPKAPGYLVPQEGLLKAHKKKTSVSRSKNSRLSIKSAVRNSQLSDKEYVINVFTPNNAKAKYLSEKREDNVFFGDQQKGKGDNPFFSSRHDFSNPEDHFGK